MRSTETVWEGNISDAVWWLKRSSRMLHRELPPPFFSSSVKTQLSCKNTHTALLLCRCRLDLHTTGSHLRQQGEERWRPPSPPGEQIQREAAREEKLKSPAPQQKKNRRATRGSSGRRKIPPPKKVGSVLMESCQKLEFPGGFKAPKKKTPPTPPHTHTPGPE